MLKLKVKKLYEDAKLPVKVHDTDGCYDLFAHSMKVTEKYIEYGTGLSMEPPEGYDILLFPRSSISKMDLVLCNSVGYGDNGYRGEYTARFKFLGGSWYKPGDRIIQIRLIKKDDCEIEEVVETSDTSRGDGGYGSTGN